MKYGNLSFRKGVVESMEEIRSMVIRLNFVLFLKRITSDDSDNGLDIVLTD